MIVKTGLRHNEPFDGTERIFMRFDGAAVRILRMDMPRSLHFCLNGVVKNLNLITNRQSSETQRRAGLLQAEVHYGRIEDILEQGLHEYLTDFMDRIYEIGDGIAKDFLVPVQEAA